MGNGIRVKHNHVLQKLPRKRKKSGKKYQSAIKWYVTLLIREKKEGNTKWIEKTKVKATLRLKKYGIVDSMISEYIESKGYKDLLS